MGKAVAKAVIRADNRKLAGDLRRSKRMFGKAFQGIGRGIKGSLGAVLSPLGVGAGALGFAAIGKEVLDFEQTLTDIEIQGDASAQVMDKLRGTIAELGDSNALSRTELSALALEMVNLEGKAGLNADKLKVLADAAFATSAPVQELAGLSLALGNAFGLVDPAKLKEGLDGIITAGKEGSIPLAEMNILLQQNGASFAKFAGQGVAGVSSLAATLQGLRKDFGSAGEAGTALGAIMGVFQVRELQLRKAGIEVKKSNGDFRDLADIVSDIEMSGIVSDAEKFNKAFGTRKEARLALDSLIKRSDVIEDITKQTIDSNAIELDAAKRRTTESFRIKKSFNDIKLTIADAFTPSRIKKFAEILGTMAKGVGFIADNIEIFVALLAAIKISQLVGGFGQMAVSSKAMAASTGTMSGAMRNIGRDAAIAGAAFAGWKTGQMLDDWLGISNAIGNLAGPSKQEEAREGTGFLRDRAQELTQAKQRRQQRSAFGFGEESASSEDIVSNARRLAFQARDKGLIGEGGQVDKAAVFKAQTGRDLTSIDKTKGEFGVSKEAEQLAQAIKQAIQISSVAEKAGPGAEIKITIDAQGLLKAEVVKDRESRRAPQ